MRPLQYPSVDAPPGRGRLRGRQRLVTFLRVAPFLMLLMTAATVVWTVLVMRATASNNLGMYVLLVTEIYVNWAAVLFTRDRFCPRAPLPSYKNGSSLHKVTTYFYLTFYAILIFIPTYDFVFDLLKA
jgi:hypothetical protein